MPTAAQFDAAALRLDELAERARRLAGPLQAAMAARPLVGGRLEPAVHDAVLGIARTGHEAAAALAATAAEARRRAAVVRLVAAQWSAFDAAVVRHAAALDRWERHDAAHRADPLVVTPAGPRPVAPTPPPPPPGWAEW